MNHPQSDHKPVARILFRAGGRGLEQDAAFLDALLSRVGFKVEIRRMSVSPHRIRLHHWSDQFLNRLSERAAHFLINACNHLFRRGSGVTVSIHLQTPFPLELSTNGCNWLVPNQEWFPHRRILYLKLFDCVACKTREAERIFQDLHHNALYLGFSGKYVTDRAEPSSAWPWSELDRNQKFFVHVAGNSTQKGTEQLLSAWRDHAHWPVLVVVTDRKDRYAQIPANVRILSNLSSVQLKALRDAALAVLAPSSVEGFGHVILEALAGHCMVLTTDAAPMNELVQPSRGILVQSRVEGRIMLGTSHRLVPEALEQSVELLLDMPEASIEGIRDRGVAWAKYYHAEVCENWEHHLHGVLKGKC